MNQVLPLLLILLWPLVAMADQHDPRLPALFERLRQADDVEGEVVAERIQEVWALHADPFAAAMLDEGTLRMSQRDYRQAYVIFDGLVQRYPDFAEAWNKRATVLYAMGEYDRSVVDIQTTLALEPRHYGALAGLGLIDEALGRDEAAILAYEATLRLNPHQPGIRRKLDELRAGVGGRAI